LANQATPLLALFLPKKRAGYLNYGPPHRRLLFSNLSTSITVL
jgi:hypothetical protein